MKTKIFCDIADYETIKFFNNKPINFKRSPWPRSQDLNPLISLPFAISILRRKNMIRWGSCVGEKPYFYFLKLISQNLQNPMPSNTA